MPQVLPIFPIYPSPSFLKYNVSLGIPGPKLHDIPTIGPIAKKNGYPNSVTAVLIPDIEYIKKFAKAEIGIAAAMVNITKAQNLAKIKDPKVREQFEKNYGSEAEKTGMYNDALGFFAIEKAIFSSMFETQKPYFEIAQFVIKNIAKIEDIIARIMPLVGAATQPLLAPAFKSRKPKGNGPAQRLLTPYGTPQALGYQNGKELQGRLDKMSTEMSRGDGVSIDKTGKYTKIPNPKTLNQTSGDASGNTNGSNFPDFVYATISTIYSTGRFIPEVDYKYQYIDLPNDLEPDEVATPVVDEEELRNQDLPDRIILGIYNKDGIPIEPNAKIKYWGLSPNGLDLEIQDSIFEKAPWIKNEKWIFGKAIDYPNVNTWKTPTTNIYIWQKWLRSDYQGATPPDDEGGWTLKRYKDVIDFNNEENQVLKFKENDPIIVAQQTDINDYREYYNYITEQQLEAQKIPADERPEIKRDVEGYLSEKYPNDKIVEEIQNFAKFGELVTAYYKDIDIADWSKFYDTNPPAETVPSGIRKLFKPMRFNLGGKVVWINPELDYDLKIIKVDPVLQIDYKSTEQVVDASTGESKANEIIKKNSEIREFIKSKLQIVVFEKASQDSEFVRTNFSMTITRGDIVEEFTNIESYELNNWQIKIDNLTGEKTNSTSEFNLKLYFDKTSLPPSLRNIIGKEYRDREEYFVDTSFYDEETQYSGKNWSRRSLLQEIYDYSDLRAKLFTNDELNADGANLRAIIFSRYAGATSVTYDYPSKVEYDYDLSFALTEITNGDIQYQEVDYYYYTQYASDPNLLRESLELINTIDLTTLYSGTSSLPAIAILNQAVNKFEQAKTQIKTYIRGVRPSTQTTDEDGPYETFDIGGGIKWKLRLISGLIDKIVFFDEDVSSETTVGTGQYSQFNPKLLPPLFKSNIIEIRTGNLSNSEINRLDNSTSNNNYGVNLITNDLTKFQISVFDSDRKYRTVLVDDYGNQNILNKRLQDLGLANVSMSSGRYGSGFRGGPCTQPNGAPVLDDNGVQIVEPDNPQSFGYLRRQQVTELDVDVYYIIEGIRKNKNIETQPDTGGVGGAGSKGSGGGSGGGGGGYYKIRDALGIAKIMIELIVDLGAKLFPAITKLINLIKNPASFVTEIIKSKLEDKFLIFNPDVTKIMTDIVNFKQRVDKIKDKIRKGEKEANQSFTDLQKEKRDLVDEMKKYVKRTKLANYIHVNREAEFKFLIDGPGLIGFFSLLFGLELNISGAFDGGVPIRPIFSQNLPSGNLDSFLKQFQLGKNNPDNIKNGLEGQDKEITDGKNQAEIDEKVLKYLDITKPDDVTTNKVVSKNGKEEYYEEVSITYSTGRKIEGIDYEYIYINQSVDKLIREGDELIDKGSEIDFNENGKSPLDNYQLAIEKYQEAYNSLDENDNSALKKTLLDKIKALKNQFNLLSQPLLKLILGLVTFPLKVIFSIIQWILDFFKRLVNPLKFPSLIAEFLSFKWIMTFFTPKGLLEMAGIKFNPEKVIEWCIAVNVKNPIRGTGPFTSEYLIPDDYIIADLNEFLSVSFWVKLPAYTAKQYRDLCLKPFRLFTVILCLIERIINSFIMLIWSILGITAVIPPPLIKLCNKIPENAEPKDLRDLLNGLFADSNLSVVSPTATTEDLIKGTGGDNAPTGDSYDFIYEVKLPDGTIRRDLDRDEVQKLIDQNKGLDFDFLNFETLE